MHSTRSFLSPSLFSFLADEHKSLVSGHICKPLCCPLATKGFERRYSWAHTDLVLSDEQLGQTGIQAWSSNMDECVYPPTAVLCLSRRGWDAGPRFGDSEADRVASSLAWCLRVVHECLRDTGIRIRPPVPPMVRAFVYYGPQFVCDSQTEPSGSVLRFSKPRLETDAGACVMSEFFGQGDREREEGLTVSPFMDRQTADTAKCQLAFIKFIVRPMSELVHHISPDVSRAMLANLEANSVKWGGSSLSSSNRSRK
eukprot:m51a1_g4833 putative high affinity cgmp-specific 3 -cyclic phosphodiesterase 9a isoform x3 (255) ;mRNA; f:200201-204867